MSDDKFSSVYDIRVRTIDGADVDLGIYRSKVLLIVNLASECGFTDQYHGLQELQERFGSEHFLVLGFPCNQFGGQEPGSEAEIKQFACSTFKVSFPLFGKVDVNGEEAHPLFTYLKERAPGILGTSAIKWNFTKFLIDKAGIPIRRYGPNEKPEKIAPDITVLLK